MRVLLSSFLFLFLLSYSAMAQAPDPLSYIKKAELKSDVVGSYPTEIWKYSWIVEYWSIMEKTTIAYTSFGAVAEETVIGDDGNVRTLNTYNQNQTISEVVIQKKEGEEWVNERKDSFEYDEVGNIIVYANEVWYQSAWLVEYKNQNSYTYDDLGRKIGMEVEEWDKDTNGCNQRQPSMFQNHLKKGPVAHIEFGIKTSFFRVGLDLYEFDTKKGDHCQREKP